jgi:hypothetical protein
VHPFRLTFLCFMTWLLVAFLPAHTRGRITMNASDDCCAPLVEVKADDCCEPAEDQPAPSKPSAKDQANCAVCFWAAGLLSVMPVSFEHSLAERAFEVARHYDAQVRREATRLNHHGRDPPTIAC